MTTAPILRSRPPLGLADFRSGDPAVAGRISPRHHLDPMDIVISGEQREKIDGWADALRDSGFVLVPVNTRLDSVLSTVGQRRPGALVVDLSDLTRVGLELAQQIAIRDEFLALPILYLLPESARLQNVGSPGRGWDRPQHNGFALSADVQSALNSILHHAADFLIAPVTPYELSVRLSRLVRVREPSSSESRAAVGPVEIDDRAHRVSAAGREIALRKKEYDLLLFLVRNAGVVFTRDALLRWVWGPGFTGDARTVDVHVRRLRSKLGGEAASVIETVRRVGYRLSAPAGDGNGNGNGHAAV